MGKSKKKKAIKTILLVILGLMLITAIGKIAGWFDTYADNKAEYVEKKIDDATRYETKKKVEDTCRSMIASYESDKLMYKQYKDSKNEEKQSWAEQAKMRANKTAATYNNYILENSFIWAGNVPDDIRGQLNYIE